MCMMTTAGYLGDRSPNRADAAIWALTALFPSVVKEAKSSAYGERTPETNPGYAGIRKRHVGGRPTSSEPKKTTTSGSTGNVFDQSRRPCLVEPHPYAGDYAMPNAQHQLGSVGEAAGSAAEVLAKYGHNGTRLVSEAGTRPREPFTSAAHNALIGERSSSISVPDHVVR